MYLKLVAETKNKRLLDLLDQTDQFLKRIGAKVVQQKEVNMEKVSTRRSL